MSVPPLLQHLQQRNPLEPASEDRPSVFELLATDELRDLVQPAFRYVLVFLAQRYPRYLLRLVNRHEEVYALFMLVVEGHHLRKLGTTFADQFYGLGYQSTRHRVTPNTPASSRLSRNQKLSLLGFVVGLPYLKAKLKDLYERLGGGLDPEIAQARIEGDPRGALYDASTPVLTQYALRLFKIIYPYANLLYTLVEVGHDFGYAFELGWNGLGRMEYRWWMSLIGVSVVRSSGTPDLATSSRTFTDLLKNLPRQALANLFPLTLLVLKFSQWWYSPSSPRLSHAESGGSEGRVKVTPPAILKPAVKGWTELNEIRQKLEAAEEAEVSEEEGSDDDTDDDRSVTSSEDLPMTPNKASGELAYGHCPLCALAWTNPAATPTGYIGCYTCLYRFIDRMGICPVTGLDLKGEGGVESLRKVLV